MINNGSIGSMHNHYSKVSFSFYYLDTCSIEYVTLLSSKVLISAQSVSCDTSLNVWLFCCVKFFLKGLWAEY